MEQIVQFQPLGITISPSQAGLNQNNLSLSLTGTGTTWSSGITTFTVTNTGSTNASKVSQSISFSTSATLIINTGTMAGNVTISDGSSNTATLTLSSIISPTLSVTSATHYGPSTVSFSGPAQFANFSSPGTTYSVWRSSTSNYPANGLAATQIGVAYTTTSSSATPSSVTDLNPPPGPAFYVCEVVDSASQVAYSSQNPTAYTNLNSPNTSLLIIGDSIAAGHNATVLVQWAAPPIVTNSGSGYTPNSIYPLTIGAPTGVSNFNVQATGFAHANNNGIIDYAYLVNPGWGYINENLSTCTMAAPSSGTQATLQLGSGNATAGANGGWALELFYILQKWGYTNTQVYNSGFGGSATQAWVPINSQAVVGISSGLVTTSYPHALNNGVAVTINYLNGSITCYAKTSGYTSSSFKLYADSGLANTS